MKTFTQKLENLRETAYLTIGNHLTLLGEESRHSNSIIIPIRKEELRFNLDNGRWLEEIGNIIIDNTGHQYSLSVLDDERLFRVVDYIVDLSNALNK